MSTKARRGRRSSTSSARHQAATASAIPQAEIARFQPATARRRNRLRLAVAFAVVALFLLALAAFGVGLGIIGTKPVPPAYSLYGRISFVRQSPDGSKRDLFVINPDGSRQEQVTHDIGIEGTNTWSPDGKRLLVQASVDGMST